MKKFIAVLAILAVAAPAFAFNTVGFRAYSSAAAVGTTCSTVGGLRAADGTFVVRNAATYSLGTKGTSSFAPVLNQDYQINCYKSSDGTAVVAKLFFDTEATTYFVTSTFLLRFK